jgi:hypothetical protein
MTVPAAFQTAYDRYRQHISAAKQDKRLEAQRRSLFFGFLQEAFGISLGDVTLEQPVRLDRDQRQGFIDALFGDLVFEFKRNLQAEPTAPRDQLAGYLRERGKDRPHIGVLTDGILFEFHTLEGDGLRLLDQFDLEKEDAEAVFLRLDAYLFSQTQVPPTSEDIVRRFGGDSPTFQAAFRELKAALESIKHLPTLAVWRDQWGKLLSKAYGSEVGDDDLYLRHTYLSQFAKLLAYAALRGLPKDDDTVGSIIAGDAFHGEGVENIGEHDFFSWVLIPEIKGRALPLFRRLAGSLVVYDLKRIDQDLLKQLYQNLVDPAARHDLGEYYTPDWLAELTLEEIDYRAPQSLLDPACGSGSFLFAAIKRLAGQMSSAELVRFAPDNIMGMDVHPLAVTIARINYLLALSEHLRQSKQSGLLSIPVYMADALATPELEQKYKETLIVPVDEKRKENFFIPVAAAAAPEALTRVIDQMDQFARRAGDPLKLESYKVPFSKLVEREFSQRMDVGVVGDLSPTYWRGNLSLLTKLIHEQRNGIWAYILKNQSRPLVLAERKFDVIVGNPPWLSYRFIKSKTYQKEVKALYQHYKLIESASVKQFSNMDLSSLFFAHARVRYLKPGGTLAFVMPRSVITGAKQHRPFQAQGFSRVLDLLRVHPLFNVPTCVLIRQGEAVPEGMVPGTAYSGTLRAHELSLEDARPHLMRTETQIQFVDSDVRSPYYYERFRKGADLIPRNLVFIKPEGNPNSPAVITDPEADREAKQPWKGVVLRGAVEDDYIYATLLSKHLVPFGYEKLHLVALPARLNAEGQLKMLTGEGEFLERGHFRSWDWFQGAEKQWNRLKKDSTKQTLAEWANYQNKLTSQQIGKGIRIVYNASGTHLSAAIVDTEQNLTVYDRPVKGFVVDHKLYCYDTVSSPEEAHYLTALLNAPVLDTAIKAYQTRGIYKGERDIHRTPFEACTIPPFNATNPDYLELARLSQEAHGVVAALKASGGLKGSVYTIRDQARAATAAQISAIDVIARRVLGL